MMFGKYSEENFFSMIFLLSFFVYGFYLFFIVNFIILPSILIFVGLLSAILLRKKAIYFFLFILPFSGALPSLFKTGYPHNYLSSSIFLFLGLISGFLLIGENSNQREDREGWEGIYLFFLLIVFISVFFVFLRWSNITLSLRAFMRDTPVSVNNLRFSFAAIFPLLTILQFSVAPVFYKRIKHIGVDERKAIDSLMGGFIVSLGIALVQKFVNPYFFVARFGDKDWFLYQKNGGFCDQNSFAFFSGVLLLLIFYLYIKDKLNYTKFIIYFILIVLGGLLSGARGFYIFIFASFFMAFFKRGSFWKRIKGFFLFLLIFILLFFLIGKISGNRAKKSLANVGKILNAHESGNLYEKLNRATNGRAEMVLNSFYILSEYPVSGVGSGNFLFYLEYMEYGKEHLHDLTLNEFLRISDENGIIGLTIFFVFIFTFFLIFERKGKYIFLVLMLSLLFNNYLWFPEDIFIFWFALFLLEKKNKFFVRKKHIFFLCFLIVLFIFFNILNFGKLHPLTLLSKKGITYDYGFWGREVDNSGESFKWSKGSAGFYIKSNDKKEVKLYCGAPLDKIKEQKVLIFWKGKLFKKYSFTKNEFKKIILKGKGGFFELKVEPSFVPLKMGMGEDPRELGVRVYYDFSEPLSGKTSLEVLRAKQLTLFQGERINLKFKLTNNYREEISTANGYFLSYHLKDSQGNIVKNENRRFPIKIHVRPGTSEIVEIPVYFHYEKPGNYVVEFDIVKEGYFWGSSKGWELPVLKLKLKNLFSEEFRKDYLRSYFKHSDSQINKEQFLLRLVLKNNAVIKKGKIKGFSPGTDYPQFWIRDIATFLGYAKLYYPLGIFKENIMKFLKYQDENGGIPDWYDLNGKSDKNTVETDQESSLVLSAYEVFKSEPDWVNMAFNGDKILKKLSMALDYVWKYKRNKKFDLIESGLTADWGDVDSSYPDHRATKLNKKSTIVFSAYTQAKYIQAMKRLSEIYAYFGERKKALLWKSRVERIKRSLKKYLYSPEKGYFLIHFYPLNRTLYNIENNMFALGGNSEAILAGVLNRREIKRLILIAERKRKELQLADISFTLLPPYPEGFFKHPIMKPWMYQNGGVWDWIGARYIKALFKYGFKDKADKYFRFMISKHLKNLNIYEWEDKNGVGRGADFYTGAAGIVGEILFKYYGGFSEFPSLYAVKKLRGVSFIRVKIGKDSFSVDFSKPIPKISKKIPSGKRFKYYN